MSTLSDRTWMYNRFTIDGYHDKYFEKKVDEFLDFAYSIVANVDTRIIKCYRVDGEEEDFEDYGDDSSDDMDPDSSNHSSNDDA
jgi:hypothetical protein